jgi:hypothetical protein
MAHAKIDHPQFVRVKGAAIVGPAAGCQGGSSLERKNKNLSRRRPSRDEQMGPIVIGAQRSREQTVIREIHDGSVRGFHRLTALIFMYLELNLIVDCCP